MNNTSEIKRSARVLPSRYGVIDQRLINEGYLKKITPEALCLYVFLCVVADRRGRSWYSDSRLQQQVRVNFIDDARNSLLELGLIAWEAPVYSVLNIPVISHSPAPLIVNRSVQVEESCGKTLSQEEIKKLVAHLR